MSPRFETTELSLCNAARRGEGSPSSELRLTTANLSELVLLRDDTCAELGEDRLLSAITLDTDRVTPGA
jgi:hypothetical protein